MTTAGFGQTSGPTAASKAGELPIFSGPTTSPIRPPASGPPAAPAGSLPTPQSGRHPHVVPSQPWQLPERFGTQNGVQFLNQSSEVPGRMSSPFLTVNMQSSDGRHSQYEEDESLDSSPHLLGHQKSPLGNFSQQYLFDAPRAAATVTVGWTSPPLSAKFQAPKRNRSPPLPSTNIPLGGVSYPADMDSEREMQAKAKRLARFHAELNQPEKKPSDLSKKSSLGSENNQVQSNKVKFPVGDFTKKMGDSFDGGTLSDFEGLEPYSAICGLCPDMCPESERGERERKGDLDKYERLDGERNQTSVYLAVKKYTRTAEHDADLIRPLPVLQRTVDYLLDLLNQPYDEHFLGLYNFLWDRMRAIRMDLRMQHIFNHDAIRMLEQMIRLHIIAMHELSEHKKGEGFSEGFDAHLNIEQMNKTSVELFQMYDDHRKRGIIIPTEKEFRGYYALLKLDKHPGYKVEPAELSLDLAKMTPEVRCTSEILFARDVARACRTSNFVAFFRHARKATYLQACLMHAHFSKLRTQALASLHGGLQNNQGIPISNVVKWLGIEGEDIESLLQYYGFSIRRFEEPYMVKEGSFLNSDEDYPTKCSQMVKLKRSRRIVDDVRHDHILLSPDKEQKHVLHIIDAFEHGNVKNHVTEAHIQAAGDDDMLDYEVGYPSSRFYPPQIMTVPSLPASFESNIEDEMRDVPASKTLDVAVDEPLYRHPLPSDRGMHLEALRDGLSNEIVTLHVDENVLQVEEPGIIELVPAIENSQDDQALSSYTDGEQQAQPHHENEAARARLKLILRIWKQRSLRKKEIRERRQSLADAALSSLPLGPSFRQKEAPNHASGSLNIDYVLRERHVRHEKSWSTLNVSALVAPILSARNHLAKSLFWKLVLCLQTDDTGNKRYQLFLLWLRRKLMGTGRENNDEHVIYSSNLSIWKKPFDNQLEFDFMHSSPANKLNKLTVHPTSGQNQELPDSCFSVVREVNFDKQMPIIEDGVMVGLSAVIFLISESIPWVTQKIRLNKILSLIPSGSSLPLLILSSDTQSSFDHISTIVGSLGLQHLDKMIISDYSIVFIDGKDGVDNMNCFFSDDRLEDGLRWMADNSPIQPCIHQVRTRDFILTLLKSSLNDLTDAGISDMGPADCVTLFNEALDHAIEEIRFAADINRNGWPGPEVNLLKDLPCYSSVVDMLPSRGWSSYARIEPLIAAISSCKLPNFSDGLPWLSRGFDGGSDIKSQKLALEQCLCSYLTHKVGLVGGNLAAREACVMIQKGTGLELHGKHYYIIPRWVEIFRRIYHWRLMSLSSGDFSLAYVLERGIPDLSSSDELRRHSVTALEMGDLEETPATQQLHQLHSTLAQLSLDELIEMSCNVSPLGQPKLVSKLAQASEASSVDDLNTSEGHHSGDDLRGTKTLCQDLSSFSEQNEDTRYADLRQRVDRLNELLERCNKQQNVNSERLAIYF